MVQEVDREGVRRLMPQGAQIIDMLPAQEYGENHPPGALQAKELDVDPDLPAEQVMHPGPNTYRPFVSVQEMQRTMTERNVESSPVTTSDGKLVGLVRKQDIGP